MKSNQSILPNWWKHSPTSWYDIDHFFSDSIFSNSVILKEHFKENRWQSVSTGRSNNSYYFFGNQCNFFIQITNRSNTQFLPYEKVINLEEIVNANDYKKMKPWLVDTFFQSKEVRIQQWFESKSLDLSLNKNKDIIDTIAEFLAKLHQARSVELPSFNLKKHLIKYQQIALDKDKNRDVKKLIDSCLNNAFSKLQTYHPSALCHYDLNVHNILFNANDLQIKIIDWEYACMGDPVLDIATVISNFKFIKEYETYFISSYRQHLNKSIKIDLSDEKLTDMKLLNQSIFQLWEYGQ